MDTYQMGAELQAGMVRILTSKGTTAGTGFVVTNDGLIATCSHVIQKKEVQMRGDPLPEKVNIIFRATGDQAEAWIETDWWRPNIGDDIAILRIDGCLPVGVEPLLLGSSSGTEQHDFFTFGFSATNPEQGSSVFGKILAETRLL